MKKIIYLGMANKPYEVFETAHIENFRPVYQYKNNEGKEVMLKSTKDHPAYYPPHDFVQYPNSLMPMCKAGQLYPINILDKGYSGHYFELVEV